jgi:hypothetical protein
MWDDTGVSGLSPRSVVFVGGRKRSPHPHTSHTPNRCSFCELWSGDINGKEYSHSRVYKISGDQFYALLSGQKDAMFQLYKALPTAIKDYLKSAEETEEIAENSALDEIKSETRTSKRTVLDQITFENYSFYLGFDKL